MAMLPDLFDHRRPAGAVVVVAGDEQYGLAHLMRARVRGEG